MCLSYLNSFCKKNFMLNIFVFNDKFKYIIYFIEILFEYLLFIECVNIN